MTGYLNLNQVLMSLPRLKPRPLFPNPPSLPKPLSLYEIHKITYMDLVLDNDRKQRKFSQEVRKIREQLLRISDQHQKWWEHVGELGKHNMGNDTYIYLNQSRPPYWMKSYPEPEVWETYVKAYRADWWRKTFNCEFNPMCPCKTAEFCGCFPFSHGVQLVDGATEIDGWLREDEFKREVPMTMPQCFNDPTCKRGCWMYGCSAAQEREVIAKIEAAPATKEESPPVSNEHS